MKILSIIRGLPGAGKSTLSGMLASADRYIFETDKFFVSERGIYNFDSSLLTQAREWCIHEVEREMWHAKDAVNSNLVVADAFTTEAEIQPYFDLAEKYGYRVVSIILENRHGNTNIHDVKDKTLDFLENNLRNNMKLR